MRLPFTYWVRTAVGLENIFITELGRKARVAKHAVRHRSVFFELKENVADSTLCASLRTADDIYRFMGQVSGIDNTKQSVKKIEEYFLEQVLHLIPPSSRPVRVTASFLGERNFNRYYIEYLLHKILSTRGSAPVLSNENGDKWVEGELRIRIHIEDDQCYFGMGLQDKPLHRRQWRGESYSAQLHPPVAAAMAMLADPGQRTHIIDPFCGSGTILIESALQYNGLRHMGFDTDASAIAIAMDNARSAGVRIEWHVDDFIRHYKQAGEYILVTNPPWGEKYSIDEQIFYNNLECFIEGSVSAVLLVPQDIKDSLQATGRAVKEVCTTRVRGKLASILHINPLT